MVPCGKKSDRSRNLTGTIDFFFLPSLECFLPPAASSQSAAIWEATWDARQLIGYLLSILLFLLFSPSCSFFKSPSQFPIISAQQFFFFFSWNFHPGDLSLLSVGLQRHDSPALSDFSLRLFSLKSRRLIFSSFLSLMMMTVNAHVEDAVWAVLRRWQVTIWKFATEVLSSYVAAFRDKQDALSLPLPRWCLSTDSIFTASPPNETMESSELKLQLTIICIINQSVNNFQFWVIKCQITVKCVHHKLLFSLTSSPNPKDIHYERRVWKTNVLTFSQSETRYLCLKTWQLIISQNYYQLIN